MFILEWLTRVLFSGLTVLSVYGFCTCSQIWLIKIQTKLVYQLAP